MRQKETHSIRSGQYELPEPSKQSSNVMNSLATSMQPMHPQSFTSNESSNIIDLSKANQAEAMNLAMFIFSEYLAPNAKYFVELDISIRKEIFLKFGCPFNEERIQTIDMQFSDPNSLTEGYNKIDAEELSKHLNLNLFSHTLEATLTELNEAFEEFKETQEYQFLKEEFIRQDKMYDVLIEGNFVADLH